MSSIRGTYRPLDVSAESFSGCRFFDGISVADREKMVRLFRGRLYRERVHVLRHGDPSTEVYFIMSGEVQATLLNGEGTLRLTSFQSHGKQWIQVADNGPGIAEEDLDHIFKPFFTRKKEGTGLGLAIAQGVVVDHGGQIKVTSVPGQETTFTVSFPLSGIPEESA